MDFKSYLGISKCSFPEVVVEVMKMRMKLCLDPDGNTYAA